MRFVALAGWAGRSRTVTAPSLRCRAGGRSARRGNSFCHLSTTMAYAYTIFLQRNERCESEEEEHNIIACNADVYASTTS